MTGSDILDIIREQFPVQLGIELATVVSPMPNLSVRVDNMDINLGQGDLIVSAHLLPVERYVSMSNTPGNQVNYNGDTHEQAGDKLSASNATLSMLDNILIPGDRVAVMSLPGGQQYLIWDKVVIL